MLSQVTLLKQGPNEQLQRACTLLRTLASQREAQMAVAWVSWWDESTIFFDGGRCFLLLELLKHQQNQWVGWGYLCGRNCLAKC